MTVIKSRPSRIGMLPGSVIYTGEHKVEQVNLSLMTYDRDGFHEDHNVRLEDALARLSPDKIAWLNLNGLHDTELVRKLGDIFCLHPSRSGRHRPHPAAPQGRILRRLHLHCAAHTEP